ncbi:hypothetical protein CVT24_008138 [Panaeolus cyanescens]|uniref:Uncharacterized protein n=1 Tax=Panaeolus cyanescens TaxID=181874 RepID=A0A409W4L0_9AGAR|nr:hypothetical protein CVT24_008138 [Panaeolus cyanescens]
MGAARIGINILIVLLAVAGGIYQIYLKSVLSTFGIYPTKVIQPKGNKNCKTYPGAEACESKFQSSNLSVLYLSKGTNTVASLSSPTTELVIHQPSGLVYLACSTPERRKQWLPGSSVVTATTPSQDYFAIFDPSTSKFTRLNLPDFNKGRGLETHGLGTLLDPQPRPYTNFPRLLTDEGQRS